jgi:hypothetical protein
VAKGYRCNLTPFGEHGPSGGFKVERYVDEAGHECAYYDTTLLFPTNAGNLSDGPDRRGRARHERPDEAEQTATLVTPAMQTPHESLLVNAKRGLLAAVAGNPLFAPGQVDLYDLTRTAGAGLSPRLPVGVLGHESGFSPDGNTFWAASLGRRRPHGRRHHDPSLPRVVYTGRHDTHAITISDDGNRAYLAAGAGFPRNEAGLPGKVNGVEVLDVSEVQARSRCPRCARSAASAGPTSPSRSRRCRCDRRQALPRRDGRVLDHRADADHRQRPAGRRGRIIDISDETKPAVVSDLRLEVNQPDNRPKLTATPGATSSTGGYAGHYCAVPRRDDPQIAACSMLASGLRVFDIRDPRNPKEIAYFVAPVPKGGNANAAFSSASFAPERREVWYSDGSRGFFALRLAPGLWPAADAAAGGGGGGAPVPSAAPSSPAGSGSGGGSGGGSEPPAEAAPPPAGGSLPATGGVLPLAALTLLGAAVAVRRVNRRTA